MTYLVPPLYQEKDRSHEVIEMVQKSLGEEVKQRVGIDIADVVIPELSYVLSNIIRSPEVDTPLCAVGSSWQELEVLYRFSFKC